MTEVDLTLCYSSANRSAREVRGGDCLRANILSIVLSFIFLHAVMMIYPVTFEKYLPVSVFLSNLVK